MNPRRGHESIAHLEAKMAVGRLFNSPGWSVFYEQHNADILVMHNATRFTAAIEVESSPRNVLRNLERNLAYGCDAIAVVSLNERYFGQIACKILGHVHGRYTQPVKLFPLGEQGSADLYEWIVSLTDLNDSKEEGKS
jgi:hypothetical protein